jgi:hypothetical protein
MDKFNCICKYVPASIPVKENSGQSFPPVACIAPIQLMRSADFVVSLTSVDVPKKHIAYKLPNECHYVCIFD